MAVGRRRWLRHLTQLLYIAARVGLVGCAAAATMHAAALPPGYLPAPEERHGVLVMPDFPVYHHVEAPSDVAGAPRGGSVQRVVEAYLRDHPYFTLIEPSRVLGRLLQAPGVAEGLLNGDRARREGIQSFYRFDFEGGIQQLEQALRLYESSYGPLLAAERLAEVHQFLAFSKLELLILGMVAPGAEVKVGAQVDEHLEEMVRLDPGREIDDRKHTAEQVYRYYQAKWRLARDGATLSVDDLERARWINERFQDSVHFIVFGRVLQQVDGSWSLLIRVFSARAGLIVFEEQVPLPAEPQSLNERVDASVSRFASYTPPRPLAAPPPDEQGRLYLDLAFGYTQFVERPTRDPFHNMGVSFGGSYMATEHFSFVGKLSFTLSGRDSRGDLLSTFNSVRGFLGVGLSFEADVIATRFFMHSGFEVMTASDFSATRDIACKTYGTLDPECPDGAVNQFSLDTLGGLNVTAGFNVGLDPAFVVVQFSSAFYLLPFNSLSVLNYPLTVEVGAQYRFF